MTNFFHEKFNEVRKEYFSRFWHPLSSGISREFVYECLTEGIYNTELVLCADGLKPVSRFIVDKESHLRYLHQWALENGMHFQSRPLSARENAMNLNDKINHIGYFSRKSELVAEAIAIDSDPDSFYEYKIGKLLGYPECCNLSWSRTGEIKQREANGFFFDEYLKNPESNNNPFLNYTHASLSFFYPCRLSCPVAKHRHSLEEAVIRKDSPEFMDLIDRSRKAPVLMFWPKNSKVLSINLHFDEMFRIHFVGKDLKNGVVIYAKFFLSSLSFLDQKTDPEYSEKCLEVLMALTKGDNVVVSGQGSECVVRKGKEIVAEFWPDDFSRFAVVSF